MIGNNPKNPLTAAFNPGDPFAAVDTVDAQGQRNPYLLEGQYLLKVERIELKVSRDRVQYYLVELSVVYSDNPERPQGMMVTWMTKLFSDMGPINVKRFLAALYGIDPNSEQANTEITSDVAKLSVSPEQPCVGMMIQAQCQMIETRANQPFLQVSWRPAQEVDATTPAPAAASSDAISF